MNEEETFELKKEHLLLLRELGWMPGDYGTPETDQKRPFGSSGGYAIACDIARILDWPYDPDEGLHEPDVQRARQLFSELSTALKVVLNTCSIVPGVYSKAHRDAGWTLQGGCQGAYDEQG